MKTFLSMLTFLFILNVLSAQNETLAFAKIIENNKENTFPFSQVESMQLKEKHTFDASHFLKEFINQNITYNELMQENLLIKKFIF